MKHTAVLPKAASEISKRRYDRKIPILASLILMVLCVFTWIAKSKPHRSNEAANFGDTTVTAVFTASVVTPTKWWIKPTATVSTNRLQTDLSSDHMYTPEAICSKSLISQLKPGMYAYISLSPPLPNRMRSSAGLLSNYLGQIEPGAGLKIIYGPLCADSYSWWLIEANKSGLRGWTVEGKRSEQWILPCPNPGIACSKTITPTSTPVPANTQKPQATKQSECKSDRFAAGMFVEVQQDNLLILRSAPYSGEVIGRAGPLSIAKVIEGPTCTGNTIWWKLNVFDLGLTGWATENGLEACPKDSECNLEPR